MNPHFKDYYWKDGLPVGRDQASILQGVTYKIVMDPYKKRVSVEKYADGNFMGVPYDSALLNFKNLNPTEQEAWEKQVVKETPEEVLCLIRNQEDRVILSEHYHFENGICKQCKGFSPQGVHVLTQRMYYKLFGDHFDGVVLYDANKHPVVIKRYLVDEETMHFTDLEEESWDMSNEEISSTIPADER